MDGAKPPATQSRSARYAIAAIAVAAVGVIALVAYYRRPTGTPYSPPPVTFSGDSTDLKQTVVVPTLDTPLSPGQNVIWCSAFELAWHRLAQDVLHEPVRVAGCTEICARLNGAPSRESDLTPDSYYARAGRIRDGIVQEITTAMATRFPSVRVPAINLPPDGLVAYAYLQANVAFTVPYFDYADGMKFTSSQDEATTVSAFGNVPADGIPPDDLREQIQVLYATPPEPPDYSRMAEFALDPCRDSRPYQIVLAVLPRSVTLADTLADLDGKIDNWPDKDHGGDFDSVDALLIPTMNWGLTHHFADLIGPEHTLQNAGFEGFPVTEALLTVNFRLDRSGAQVAAEALGAVSSIPRAFIFDRPFLIYMKQRGAPRPFFVMWVDNAELLSPMTSAAPVGA